MGGSHALREWGQGFSGRKTKELGNQGAGNVRGSAGARSSPELPFLAEHQYPVAYHEYPEDPLKTLRTLDELKLIHTCVVPQVHTPGVGENRTRAKKKTKKYRLGSGVAPPTRIPLHTMGQQKCFWIPKMVVFEPHCA